ncbi:MAG: hypothetical protein BroJett011_00960 [Chloroflexota bacterium]|nr:MAG: hypothetical protein BroJett011_00960 [Chloroflexota bacterium]
MILTYPLPFHLFSHIPCGSEEAATVPLFNLWTLQWNIDQQMQGYPRYWDAPIFAPDKGTFAFSEPQPLSAVLAAPLWLAWQSPALGYNALVILFLILNGWFTYWLLRNWRLPPLPSLLAGLLMQSLPFVAQEMGVLQLVAIFGLLWSLLFLSRFLTSVSSLPRFLASSPRYWRSGGLCLALGPPVTFLTCSYYGLFSVFFLPLVFIFQARREHLNLKTAVQLGVVALLALALSLPFVWAQHRELQIYHFSRSAQTIEANSAKLSYYRDFLDYNLFYSRILGLKSAQGQRLFPGLGLIALAGLGLFGEPRKRVKLYLFVAVGLALLLSLGLRLNVGGVQPYQWVREWVPGFAQLRSPFRFAVLVQLHLALLAGFGLHNLSQWLRWSPKLLPGGVAALAIFEMLALPLPLQPVPLQTEAAPWQGWFNEHARSDTADFQSTPRPKIVILPFAPSSKVEDFEQTTRWLLANRFFEGDMLNGYSGFFPADHARVRDEMLKFPTPAGLQLLQKKGIEYVVVYHHLADTPSPQTLETYLTRLYEDERAGVTVYALK